MALAHQSISTINSPQFINLSPLDINPLISSCEIKIFYLGENRNGTFINKDVAAEMAKTLRGVPIVGYYKEDKNDFRDHGEQLILDADGIHFNCLTKPYGFVAPNAQVWFKDFEEIDQEGKSVIRTYLMTQGFLWTGQFQEAEQIFKDDGKPQSMELDKETVKGQWTKKLKDGLELFIINDAIFSKLCILGDDVEPCFEGAGITPSVKQKFTLDNKFKNTLFSMMKQLTAALNGGKEEVADIKQDLTTAFSEQKKENKEDKEDVTSFEKKKEDEKSDTTSEENKEKQNPSNEENKEDKEEEDKKKKEDKYALLEEDFNKLKNQYNILQQEYNELKQFKLNIENKEKDQLINQFDMLSNDDKKDVIDNKSKYTLDEIKAKLAVICFEKKINFVHQDQKEDSKEEIKNDIITTFNVETQQNFEIPEWVQAVENTMNKL